MSVSTPGGDDGSAAETGRKGTGRREKLIGVFIASLAVLLAIASLGGDNASKDATLANIDVTNTWAFFQAKNMRRASYILAADRLEMELAKGTSLTEEERKARTQKLQAYRDYIKKLTSDPKKKEGLDELWAKGKTLEKVRDEALKRDPFFDWARAFLQISIVLASVALITETVLPLLLAGGLGAIGLLSAINGFFLLL